MTVSDKVDEEQRRQLKEKKIEERRAKLREEIIKQMDKTDAEKANKRAKVTKKHMEACTMFHPPMDVEGMRIIGGFLLLFIERVIIFRHL